MPCIGHNTQVASGPFPRKLVRRCRWTNHVIATLHNIPLNMANFFHVIQDFLILIQKAIINEIVSTWCRTAFLRACPLKTTACDKQKLGHHARPLE
jgi:hypothetical protein